MSLNTQFLRRASRQHKRRTLELVLLLVTLVLVWKVSDYHSAKDPLDTPFHVLQGEEPIEGYREGGYYPVRIGEEWERGRYTVVQKLGWGDVSTVWLASDHRSGGLVAIKVLTSSQSADQLTSYELGIHDAIKHDNTGRIGRDKILSAKEHFTIEGQNGRHLCQVFDVMQEPLDSVLWYYRRQKRVVPLSLVRQLMTQVLTALHYLHSLGAIHADLKPDNIMLSLSDATIVTRPPENQKSKKSKSLIQPTQPPVWSSAQTYDNGTVEVRLADLGSANWERRKYDKRVQTAPYRAPEVDQGLGWGTPIDIWSLGCVIYETLLGRRLFQEGYSTTIRTSALGTMAYDLERTYNMTRAEAVLLTQLMSNMLVLEPAERWIAEALLSHPWLSD